MIRKFQHKLLIGFVLLLILIVTPILIIVNSTIDTASQLRVESSLVTAQKVFEKFLQVKRGHYSDLIASFIDTQPTLRVILETSGGAEDNLFGDSAGKNNPKDLNEQLFSSVESLGVYKESAVFVITNRDGEILFNKSAPGIFGFKLPAQPIVETALKGNEVATFWNSEDNDLKPLTLFPDKPGKTIYNVFLKPVVYPPSGPSGVVIVGFPIENEDLLEVKAVSQADVAFVSGGQVFGSTGEASAMVERLAAGQTKEGRVQNVVENGEEFIALVSPLHDSLDNPVASSIIHRSKTRELAVYTGLKDVLNYIVATATALAIFLSYFFSGGITRSIRDLAQGVKAVRAGNLEHVVQVGGQDELRVLADDFNVMTQELKEKERIKKTFKRYVNPDVVNTLLNDENKIKLGGDRRQLLIYFADIAGFTTISEKLAPERVVEFLNQYLSRVTRTIEGNQGIVDKYIGDAVVAYWLQHEGDPKPYELACKVALEHIEIVKSLREEWSSAEGLGSFDARIGLHAGPAILGNIGSEERMDYTMIGDNVNTAARLESINKLYGTRIMVSEDITRFVREKFQLRELDLIRVAGKSNPIRIYELVGAAGHPKAQFVREFEAALELYRRGDFAQAGEAFQNLKRLDPGDLPSGEFHERCVTYLESPPPEWDGVYKALKK